MKIANRQKMWQDAIDKWEWIVENQNIYMSYKNSFALLVYYLKQALPQLINYSSNSCCSLCYEYHDNCRDNCLSCPLYEWGQGCTTYKSIWNRWRIACISNKVSIAKAEAKNMLNFLVALAKGEGEII